MLLPASILFGWFYQKISTSFAFTFPGSCALLTAILLVAWIKPVHRATRSRS